MTFILFWIQDFIFRAKVVFRKSHIHSQTLNHISFMIIMIFTLSHYWDFIFQEPTNSADDYI